MKGPVLFLLALGLAAAAAVLVVLPAARERTDLRKDVATAREEPEAPSPLAEVEAELATAAGPVDAAAASLRLSDILREYAPESNPPGDGAPLVVEWERLPALLRSLDEVAGILEAVRVEPDADVARCRVTVVRTEARR